MKRRKFLIGAGAFSVGATAVVGSGSFAEVEAQRGIKVEVVRDSEAYLRMEQHPESVWSNGTDAETETVFVVEEDGRGHLGVSVDAVRNGTTTRFDDVFRVCNTGKDCVCVWVKEKNGDNTERVTFYDSRTGESIEGEDNAVQLEVGECLDVGFEVDATDLDGRNALIEGVRFRAEANCPCSEAETSSETAWGDGDSFPGANWFTYFEYSGDGYTTDLVAGRDKRVVGEVKVVDTNGGIEVTYTTDAGWRIVETHLAVSSDVPEAVSGNEWFDEGWLNRAGNPVLGAFPEGDDFDEGVGTATYTVNVDGFPVYVGAHAVVEEEE